MWGGVGCIGCTECMGWVHRGSGSGWVGMCTYHPLPTNCHPPTTTRFDIPHSRTLGVVPPVLFVLLLEGKANLKGCGTVTMPSAEAMAQASPDVIARFQAIKEVNLNGMRNLAGECVRFMHHYY